MTQARSGRARLLARAGLIALLVLPAAPARAEAPEPEMLGACAETRFRVLLVRTCFAPQPEGSPLARLCREEQEHRTSQDFALPQRSVRLRWKVGGVKDPEAVRFDVREDRLRAEDPRIYQDLAHDLETDVHARPALYVSDPRGAEPLRDGQETFVVCAYEQ